MAEYKPKILGFLCNWCSFAGADLAGVSRVQYPTNIRIIRVMCSGRVDPMFVIEGFLKGADGVMVLGCHPGDCHYSTGNYEAMNMSQGMTKLLQYVGVNRDRFMLDWVSASEGMRYAEMVGKFTARIEKLGPLGVAEKSSLDSLTLALQAAKKVTESEKFRWVMSKQTEFAGKGNRYGEKFSRQEMNRALEGTIIDALAEKMILISLGPGPLSVRDIAQKTGLPSSRVLQYVTALRRKGMLNPCGAEGNSPLYCLTGIKDT